MSRHILITGGSRGIGRATALLAAARGWRVTIGYHGNAVAAEAVVAQTGGTAIAGDVADPAAVRALFAAAESAQGRLDAVVVNAGIVAPAASLARMDDDRLRRVVDTNLMGALYCAREAAHRLPRPADQPAGALVFLSSIAATLGAPNEYVDYAAAKGAVDSLTRGLAKELAGENVRVNAVRPGLIDTEIHASGGRPDRAQALASLVPMGRPGRAEEVAQAVLWLCEPGASYTSGAIVDVGGGR